MREICKSIFKSYFMFGFVFLTLIEGINENTYAGDGWLADGINIYKSSTSIPYGNKYALVADGLGGAIIAWQYYSTWDGLHDYAQKIHQDGTIEWKANGLEVISAGFYDLDCIMPDNEGGGIAIYDNNMTLVTAERITSAGLIPWDPMKPALSGDWWGHRAYSGKAANDGLGNYIVVWQDNRNGNDDIFAQKIDNNYTFRWAYGGVTVCAKPNSQLLSQMANDGAGGAIVIWQEENGNQAAIYTQRINSVGEPQWLIDGEKIADISSAGNLLKLTPNPSGGVILTWINNNGSSWDIWAQKLSLSGTPQWGLSGVNICSVAGKPDSFDIISNGSGGAIIAWQDNRRGNWDVYSQLISDSGIPAWGTNGSIVCSAPNDQVGITMAQDEQGGAVIAWQDYRNSNWDIFAQRINSNGLMMWAENGVRICAARGAQERPLLVSDRVGGTFIIWQDLRDGTDDIYAQRIKSTGSIPIKSQENGKRWAYSQPNPFMPTLGQKAVFYSDLVNYTPGFKLKLINMKGHVVKTLNNQPEWDGTNEEGRLCEGGVYLFQIEAEGKRVSGKVVLIK